VWEIIQGAGWPIWPLVFASVIATAIILERVWTLRANVISPQNLLAEVQNLVKQKGVNKQSIDQLRNHSYLGAIFATALEKNSEGCNATLIKEAVEETGRAVFHSLEKYLSTLGTIATVAPLLGLFGTIIGMVELFSSFTSAGADVTVFARGISIALYNTAAGIIVAVPAMIFYRFFKAKVESLIVEMEQQAIMLVELIQSKR
jgi:biopolymer transport protein ExbB